MIKYTLGILILSLLVCITSFAFTIDGDFADWVGVPTKVDDPQDMADSSGDIKMIQAGYKDGNLYLRMVVYGIITPSVAQTPAGMTNRYYYHWILDTDDNLNTGFNNSMYEGTPTKVTPIGVDIVIMVGWRDGKVGGVEVYDPITEEMFMENFDFATGGDSMEAMIPLEAIKIKEGASISVSAFQEGASNDWQVDWLEPATLKLVPMAVRAKDKLSATWASLKIR